VTPRQLVQALHQQRKPALDEIGFPSNNFDLEAVLGTGAGVGGEAVGTKKLRGEESL
jgi:hypothetical protein